MKLEFNSYKKKEVPEKAIIAIHGWGGNKNSFKPFLKNLKIDNVEWFLPEAPYLIKDSSTIDPPEFDINDPSKKSWTYKKEDGNWEIKEPMKMMDDFFNEIIFKKYPPSSVYVMGFSQGAAVCYEYVAGIKKTLGGIFPIGGFLFKHSKKGRRVSNHNIDTPILIGHGNQDDIVLIEKSKIAFNKLQEEGANVKFYEYNAGHKISMNYLREMIRIING